MSDILTELQHAVEALLGYPHYHSHTKAYSLAHHKLHKQLYMKVPADLVNWPLLHAVVDNAPLVLRVGSVHLQYSTRDRAGHQKFVSAEGGQLVVCLSRGDAHHCVIEPRGDWVLSSGGVALASGAYDLSTVPLALAKKQKKKHKRHQARAVIRLPVVGVLGQSRAAGANMPVCEIRLKVKLSSASHGGARRITLKGAELVCHQRTRSNVLFAPQAAPYAVTGHRFFVSGLSFMPHAHAADMRPLDLSAVKPAARALVEKYAPGDGTFALFFVRQDEVFFAQDDAQRVYALGTAGQAFVNLALIKSALSETTDSPLVALADPALLDSKLRGAGHAPVADALQELYTKRYDYTSGPSFAQLLTHTSGLPAYPELSGNEFVEIALAAAGVKLARSNEPTDADAQFALRLRNSTLLCGAAGSGYVESPLGYALLLLTLPQSANEFVVRVLRSLGATQPFSTGLEQDAPRAAGVYSLYDGVQMPLASVAKMLSAGVFHRQDKIAGVSVHLPVHQITPDASVTLGGWCVRDMQLRDDAEAQRVIYRVGITAESCVVMLFLPKYNTAAVFGVSPLQRERLFSAENRSSYALVANIARALEDASGSGSTFTAPTRPLPALPTSGSTSTAPTRPLPALPAETPEAAEATRAAEQALSGGGAAATAGAPDESAAAAANASSSIVKFFGTDTLQSLTNDVTMRFSVEQEAQPGGTARQLVTVASPSTGMSNTFLVVFDQMYMRYVAEGPGSIAVKGAYRIVDPLTHKLSDSLLLQVLTRGADTMPLLSYRNMIFARAADTQRLTAALGVQSQTAPPLTPTALDAEIRSAPTGVHELLHIGRRGGGGGGFTAGLVTGGVLGGLAGASLYPYYGYPRPYYPYAYAPPYGPPYYYGYPPRRYPYYPYY